MVLFKLLSLWTKSYGVTTQMKPLQQYFHMVLYVLYVVLTFESVDEILWCNHSNETSSAVLLHGTVCFSLLHENWEILRGKTLFSTLPFLWEPKQGKHLVKLSYCIWNLKMISIRQLLKRTQSCSSHLISGRGHELSLF